jgi:N-methylhydantoinase A
VRIGVDVGGTFTDVVVATGRGVTVRKVPSTDPDFGLGILNGIAQALAQLGEDGSAVDEVIHATTAGSNTIIEGTGARTALVTTEGFRDVLEIGRLRVPVLYDLSWEKPRPLVERRLRVTVAERLDHLGKVLVPLDVKQVASVARALKAQSVESVAVCLLHSYANPIHEKRVAGILKRILGNIPISLSSEVLPEVGEFERTSTTVVNAYLVPKMRGYLDDLQRRLRGAGIKGPLYVMQSGGGMLAASQVAKRPVYAVESGPAAGVLSASRLAHALGISNTLTLDMGGTTAKAGIVEDGHINRATEYELGGGVSVISRMLKGGGYLVRVPSVDVAEVGTGAGGIVWVDPGGSLRVGPRSAGADPGPACYGKGSSLPTITDANVLLGYLNPESLAGGSLPIQADLSKRAFAAAVARPLRLSVTRAAWGAHLIANAGMTRALRAVSSERGRDPRNFALIAFGGSGPVHAANLARSIGVGLVIVPTSPGLFSAKGLLAADPEAHQVLSVGSGTGVHTTAALERAFVRLENDAVELLHDGRHETAHVEIQRSADLRYTGQAYELSVAIQPGGTAADLVPLFLAEHLRTYGYQLPGEPVQLVNLRVTARASHLAGAEATTFPRAKRATRQGDSARAHRDAYFGPSAGWVRTPVVSRNAVPGGGIPGPLIVEEYDSTVVIPPGFSVRTDSAENLVIAVPASA